MAEPAGGAAPPGGDPNDPAGLVTSPPSTLVKVIGTARDDVNGTIGVVLSYDSSRARYAVSPLPGQRRGRQSAASAAADAAAARAAGGGRGPGAVLALKAENLVKASVVEKVKAQGTAAWDQLQRTMADPHVREQMRRAYTSIQGRLPGGMRPEHLGAGLLVVFLACAWTFGLSKAFMASSLVGMVVAVCLQDILAGMDAKTVARNFPRRWREAVVQSTGFDRLTERQALAGFAVLFLLSTKVILTPTPTQARARAAAAAVPETPGPEGGKIPPEPPGHRRAAAPPFDMEEMYKLGFRDAKEGREYGTSLPDPETIVGAGAGPGPGGPGVGPGPGGPGVGPGPGGPEAGPGPEGPGVGPGPGGARGVHHPPPDPLDWDLNPPPRPPPPESKFGFSTVMSGFALFRFVKEVGFTPDGRFNQQLLVTNLRATPPWKMVIVALCLYNIVRVLF